MPFVADAKRWLGCSLRSALWRKGVGWVPLTQWLAATFDEADAHVIEFHFNV